MTTRASPSSIDIVGGVPEQLRTALAARYALEHEIGHGGQARVYRARDLRNPRHVAVKVLAAELATTLAADRFVREIQAAAQLVHPHILGLIESDTADGLLYYVMPYVRGETLRSKIEREKRLSLKDAARIVRDVASALDYAHEHEAPEERGIVHRDIKPENILLAGGTGAMVADFGLARAIESASHNKITISGMVVGTPPYMSPEQTFGGPVDGRSDIYSLGCVLFEMLSGRPPFQADSVERMLLLHRTAAPPSVCAGRPDLPAAVDEIVHRALQKDPDARYQRASDLAAALDNVIAGHRTPTLWRLVGWMARVPQRAGRRGGIVVTAAALLVVAASPIGHPIRKRVLAFWQPPADTTRYVVVPFRRERGVPEGLRPELILRDAIARWDGLTVVDQFQVAEAVARHASSQISVRDAQRVATRFAAGRYVWGSVASVGDSVRIHAALFDATRPDTPLEAKTIHTAPASLAVQRELQSLASAFVFRGGTIGRAELSTGTSSYAAAQAYLQGQRALQDWNLPAADTALSAAIAADRDFAAAYLWLGYVRAWMDDQTQLRTIAQRAVAGDARLPARERKLAAALLHLARGELPEACAIYTELKSIDPRDFAATYGSGECIRRDDVVVPDHRTRSRWRFRSSYHQAVLAYRDALELLPSIHKAFRARAFERVRRIMMTSANARRDGRPLPPDTTAFSAALSWEGDTLVFIPFPMRIERAQPERTISPTTIEAVTRQRAMFRDIAASWRRAFPEAVEPLEAMAVALELLGDSTALDTLRAARLLAADDEQRIRLGGQEIWLRVKLGVPDNVAGLRAARELADSLLDRAPVRSTSAEMLAALAALTGRGHSAAAIARHAGKPRGLSIEVPARTVAASWALLAYSALGGPADSLRSLERRVTTDVQSTVAPHQRTTAISQLLEQAAGLAFPVHQFPSVSPLATQGRRVLSAQLASARGDSTEARRTLNDLMKIRATRRPADLTIDITYAGARTLLAIGDRQAAIEWLDPVLNAAQLYPPEHLTRVANAGAFMRALILRADLAHQTGDRAGARRWARPVVVLWQNGDPFLQPDVQRMRALAAR